MITRHNYEEFFVLYVDNELSPADRRIVDLFVAENPDLRAELDILGQCRLDPDNGFFFKDKGSLLKQAPGSAIDESFQVGTHEEYLFLYIDKELNADNRRLVEDMAARDPSVLGELTLLRKTVSGPDPAIVFKNKERLYKKERERKMVLMPFLRIAAAAIVLLAIGMVVFNTVRNNSGSSTAGNTNKKNQAPVTRAGTDTLYHSSGTQHEQAVVQDARGGQTARKNRQVKQDAVRQGKNDRHRDGNLVSTSIPGNRTASLIKPVNTRPAELMIKDSGMAMRMAVIDHRLAGDRDNNSLALVVRNTPRPEAGNTKRSSFATEALREESALPANDNQVETDDEAMEPASPPKNKLRGVFRRVSRVFEKTANRDDDDKHTILIGNLQMALK